MFKYMKKTGLSALLALTVLTGCGDGGEKQAQLHLRKAEAALQQENFSEAKLQIDSPKSLRYFKEKLVLFLG